MRPALVTAFGPFADVERNPSSDLLEALRDGPGSGRAVLELLEVAYDAAGPRIEALIAEHEPRIVLLLGVARRAAVARLETVARNLDDARTADNAGRLRCGLRIDPGGPEAFATTLPLTLADRVRAHGLEIELSGDAGGFLCNHVFYRARAAVERLGLGAPCGFVHLPNRPLDPRWVDVVREWL